MNLPPEFEYRSARALLPQERAVLEEWLLYEPLPAPPVDHPELALSFDREADAFGRNLGFGPGRGELAPVSHPEADVPAVLPDQPMPARMLNEFVYCPRLFYYEYVEGVFMESADTERGKAVHARVDKGDGEIPVSRKIKRKKKKADEGESLLPVDAEAEGKKGDEGSGREAEGDGEKAGKEEGQQQTIHSCSVMLSSERLGVVAKMDLIEVHMSTSPGELDLLTPRSVTPVDYKVGAPRQGAEGNELWDADKMQLGLQMLILRDQGYVCDEGVIYYRATKQRVRLAMTAELEAWILSQIAAARVTARGGIPEPLVNSPKCVRCSLAPVCLPDETRLLAAARTSRVEVMSAPVDRAGVGPGSVAVEVGAIRRLIAARDDARALYLNTPGLRVGCKDELLAVKDGEVVMDEVRVRDVTHVALFGNIQLSTQAVHLLCEHDIPIAWFSMGGWFYGLTRGHSMKNVFTRIEQFRAAGDARRCLELARRFVHGKIRNQRTQLMRNHVEVPEAVSLKLKRASQDALVAGSLESLLGIEGAAAALYLQNFSGMIKVNDDDDELPGLEDAERSQTEKPDFTFDFTKRTRRPPTDPVNALLSLAYSLLAKDCTIAAHAVGFDPYVGFYHQPRFGRPALALDLMEEFRPLIAESTVLTALNNRMILPTHFVRAGDAVNLTAQGRKIFFQAYEQRMCSLITHPVFDYRVSYRRVLELQARLLARHLTGEIPEYIPMVTR